LNIVRIGTAALRRCAIWCASMKSKSGLC